MIDGFVDSHCHLYDTRGADVEQVVGAARAAGVAAMINVGCDAATTAAAVDIANRFHGRDGLIVKATAGIHPHEAVHGLDGIVDALGRPEVIAVGECGLDYFYDHSPRDAQRAVFAAQIQLAHEHQLPLVIHTRDAWDDTFDVLDAEGVPERTVFHCFTGGPQQARMCLDRGAFLSFSGIVTFPTAVDLREAAVLCPSERMLIETDSPYLAPVPHRGRTNQPAYVADVARSLAELRGVDLDAVRASTSAAACLAFPRLVP